MAHYCICTKCGETFDRDKIHAVKTTARRYGHASCYPEIKDILPIVEVKPKAVKEKKATPANTELLELTDYIKEIYGENANWVLIKKQIKKYHSKPYEYSYSGILKTLKYFYEIKGNSSDKSNGGIGIVEYIYAEAYEYYYKIFLAQQQTQNIVINEQIQEYVINKPVSNYIKNKMLRWGEED